MQTKQKVLVIVGPTASGKSALAVRLARRFGGEIISADSRQVYKGLDVGTGKITEREMYSMPHHLIDVVSPKKQFSAHNFVTKARRAIADISHHGKLPIVVGGTGFYIDALVGRITIPPAEPNKKLRAKLEKKSAEYLFEFLKKRDPRRARSIDRYNKHRLIRALEIAHSIGHVPKNSRPRDHHFDVLWIGIKQPEKKRNAKIRVRLRARIRRGMIAEAKRLYAQGLTLQRMEKLGLEYRHLARFLQKQVSRKELEEGLLRDIRRYAKRQLTYWKRNGDIRWFKSATDGRIASAVKEWLTK